MSLALLLLLLVWPTWRLPLCKKLLLPHFSSFSCCVKAKPTISARLPAPIAATNSGNGSATAGRLVLLRTGCVLSYFCATPKMNIPATFFYSLFTFTLFLHPHLLYFLLLVLIVVRKPIPSPDDSLNLYTVLSLSRGIAKTTAYRVQNA